MQAPEPRGDAVHRLRRAKSVLMWAVLVSGIGLSGAVANPVESLSFTPVADTYVDSENPTTSYGTLSYLWVDSSSPVRRSFLRYELTGLTGRTVTGLHLRMYNTNGSPIGGKVYRVPDNTWTESMTWDGQASIDHSQLLGSLGAVVAKTFYTIDLTWPGFPTEDGPVSIAIESTNSDAVRWGSSESTRPPTLIVDVETIPGFIADGLSPVATPYEGATEPTYYATNHHLALTSGGRLLCVYGFHATGVQLAWRDAGGGWLKTTTGNVTDGLLLTAGTGKKPASIAVARDPEGAEHAWVVWSEPKTGPDKPVNFRRLSGLEAFQGPAVGPLVVVEPPGLGNSKVDIAFETQPDGQVFGCISWLKKTGDSSYAVKATWFTDLTSDQPEFHDTTTVVTATSVSRIPTLVSTPAGIRLLVRAGSKLQIFAHNAGTPLSTWSSGAIAGSIGSSSAPSATRLDSGVILTAVESNTTDHKVTVFSFTADGYASAVDLAALTGYKTPSIATDGTRAWIVMIRLSDGLVVSRERSGSGAWSGTDRVEIGPEGGGNYAWPNLIRTTDGRLRFIVDGPSASSAQNAVLAFQREL
jgi:hypothetical protein